MASPFSIFRKHQKWLMAGVTLFAMFAFVAINPFSGSGGGSRSGGQAQTTLATWRFGKITLNDVQARLQSRRRLNNFIAALETKAGQRPTAPAFRQSEDDVLMSMIVAKKAETLGMTVNNKAINDYLDQITGNVLDAKQKDEAFSQVSRGGVSQDQLFDELRFELLAQNFVQLVAGDLMDDGTPLQRWDYFCRLNRMATIQALPVDVKDFVSKVPDPTDEQLRAFFEQYKEQQSRADSPTPGFREPVRAKFDYYKADDSKFTDAQKPKVTDAEIKAYYDENKDDFRKSPLDELPKTTTPPTGTVPTGTAPNGTAPSGTVKPKTTEPGKTPEPTKTPEKPKPTEPGKTVEPSKSPEKPKTPEPAKANEPTKGTDPAKTPDVPKPTDKPRTDDKPKGDEKPKSDDKPKSDANPTPDKSGIEKPKNEKTPPDEKKAADEKSVDLLRPAGLGKQEEFLAFADSADEPKKDSRKADTPKSDALKTESPKTDAPKSETPKTESPKAESPKTDDKPKLDVPKTEPPKTGAPKTEPPKSDAPKSEPPKTIPPKTEAANTTPPKTETPKKAPADEHLPSTYTAPKLPATGTKIPVVEYESVDSPKVRDTIRNELAREKGSKAISEAFKKLEINVADYERQLGKWRIANVSGEAPPAPPDFQEAGKEFGLEFHSTPMLSPEEIGQTELGKSGQIVYGGRALHSFVELGYDLTQRTYRPDMATSLDGETEFLWWRTKDEPSYVPKFEDVRAEVLSSWKMIKARDLATGKAKEYADEANKAHKTLKDLFKDHAGLTPLEVGPFSWLSRPNTPPMYGQPMSFSITKLSGIDDAGQDFMREVFDLDTGSAGTAMNQPKTVAYAIQLQNVQPSETTLHSQFLSQLALPYGDPSLQAARANANVTFMNLIKSIEEEFDYKRVAGVTVPADMQQSSLPMDNGGEED